MLKEQVVIEELNYNFSSFLVNNLQIQSHDTDLDANSSSEIVTTDVNETRVSEPAEPSTIAISCLENSDVNSSADLVLDQSTQSTSSSHSEVANKKINE